jgi:hypothetical protein
VRDEGRRSGFRTRHVAKVTGKLIGEGVGLKAYTRPALGPRAPLFKRFWSLHIGRGPIGGVVLYQPLEFPGPCGLDCGPDHDQNADFVTKTWLECFPGRVRSSAKRARTNQTRGHQHTKHTNNRSRVRQLVHTISGLGEKMAKRPNSGA